MSTTTVRVSTDTRDSLNAAIRHLGVSTVDEALRKLIFRYEVMRSYAELQRNDPEAWAEYQQETLEWAEFGVSDGLENEDQWPESL